MKKAYIVRKMYRDKESLVGYLDYKRYKTDDMSWAIYDIQKGRVIQAITEKMLELQNLGYEIRIINELEWSEC